MYVDLRGFGKAVRAARMKVNLTQEELAEKVCLSTATIKHIEAGRRYPSLPSLLRLANALNTSADQSLYETYNNDEDVKAEIVLRLNLCSSENLKVILGIIDALLTHKS